jgi:putative salt-induced outer membrane protein YdiY
MRLIIVGGRLGVWAFAVAAILGGWASADEVLFNNGDRLTGTVVSADGGKLTVKTAAAGDVVVDLKDVRTFTTDEPIELRTQNGQVINAPARASETAGAVRLADGDVSLADVKYVNFNQAWTGAVIGGAQFARGNTYADQANLSFNAIRRTLDDRFTLDGAYNFGRQRDPDTNEKVTSVDNWFIAGKYDYFFTERFYGYGSIRYEKDRIANLDRRVVPSVGVGYLWFDEPDFKFDTEAGLAFVHEKFADGDSDDSMSLRLAYHLTKDLWADKVMLFHDVEYFPSLESLDNFLLIADAGVRAAMTERMFVEYRIELRHDATPAEGLERNDYRHVVGVGWRF